MFVSMYYKTNYGVAGGIYTLLMPVGVYLMESLELSDNIDCY